jgi:predicted DNA-binding protein
MNAMTSAERSRRYRERKKKEGVSQGEATRLGPQAAEIANSLSRITGESKAEIVRILILRGVMEMLGDDFDGITDVLALVESDSETDITEDMEVKKWTRQMIKDGIERTKDYIETANWVSKVK